MIPSQELEFFGMRVNANALLISLPPDKVKQIWSEASRIFNMPTLSARLLSVSGHSECGNSGGTSSAFVLLLPTTRSAGSLSTRQSRVQETSIPVTASQSGADLVAGSASQVEWEASLTILGRSVWEDSHRGCLISPRTDHAHPTA